MSSTTRRFGDPTLGGTLPSTSYIAATAAASTSTKKEPSSSSSSSSPYNSLVAILGQRTGMSTMQAERAVGLSAITGTGIVALKVAMYAFRSLRGENKSDDESSDSSTEEAVSKQTRTASYTIIAIFRRTLRRILLDESEYIARAPPAVTDDTFDENDGSEGPLVTHQGSCHCESIQFTVLAPRVLHAQDGPGKIQFRHVQVKAANFRVYAGYENLKTYYVAYRDSGDKGAHAFCERCGIHVLYAPSKNTPNVSINVRCLRDDETRKVKLTSKKDGISDGIPVAGQFDNVNSDHLSTVSRATQPFQFQMNYVNQNPTNFEYPNRTKIQRPSANMTRKSSDISSMASSVTSDHVGIEIPVKQFYATTAKTRGQRSRRSTFSTATTASLTESGSLYTGQMNGSSYRGQMNGSLLTAPMSPPRSGGATFGGIDDFSFTGESVSLMGDHMSMSSVAEQQSSSISIRGNKHSLRVNTGRENEMVAGNPPRHQQVTSPETRNNMKHFMSKYKKKAQNN